MRVRTYAIASVYTSSN